VRDTYMRASSNKSTNSEGKVAYNYRITGDDKLVDFKKLQVTAVIRNSLNSGVNKTLALVNEDHWEFSFSPVQEADYTVDIKIAGSLLDGSPLEEVIHADKFTFKVASAESEHKADEHAAKSEAHEAAKTEEAPKDEPKPEKPKTSLWVYIGIGLANLLLVVGGYVVYRMFFSKKAKAEMDEIEKTLSDDKSAAPVKKPEASAAPSAKKTEQNAESATEAEKTEIDLSDDDDSLHIPMNDDNSLDKLFPLDSMDDSNDEK